MSRKRTSFPLRGKNSTPAPEPIRKGSHSEDFKKRSKEEPIDLFNTSHTALNAIDETFKKIEKEEPYNFPKDNDPTLHAACEALSHAL
jgi:hypothetical protein